MEHLFPSGDGPLDDHWLRPLDLVARAIGGMPRYRHFDLGDFMIMGEAVRKPRPNLILYKHHWTRRYVNLDQAGHAYKYVCPRDWMTSHRSGRYLAYRDLLIAVDHLDLWELPWMKPGLESARHGLGADESWLLHPEEHGDLDGEELEAAIAAYRRDMAWTWDESMEDGAS